MLEANTFRSMMLIGSIIIVGLLMGFMISPVIELDADQKASYNSYMVDELGVNEHKISGFQAMNFVVKAMPRAKVKKY